MSGFFGFSFLAVSAARSPLFLIQIAEVKVLQESAQGIFLSQDEILGLARVPVGKQSLFEVNLSIIENRILAHDWVDSVSIKRKFPQTLVIEPTYKIPRAIMRNAKTKMIQFVDRKGTLFGKYRLKEKLDLPWITAAEGELSERQILDVLTFLEDHSTAAAMARVSEVSFDPKIGYKVLLTYQTQNKQDVRSWMMLGPELSTQESHTQLKRVDKIIKYLSEHNLLAKQIWADAGKKIVVKFALGS